MRICTQLLLSNVMEVSPGYWLFIMSVNQEQKAWRYMMQRTEVNENSFRASIETRFNNVKICTTLPKYVEFLDVIEATERTIIEKRN